MYSQQTINWSELLQSVDDMFPVKRSQPVPVTTDFAEIERRARLLIPRRYQQRRFSEDVIRWLGTPVDTLIADTTPVTAVRVGQSLSGGNLTFEGEFPIAEIGDPQAYCNERGGGLELRNAAGECVGKFVPRVSYVSFL